MDYTKLKDEELIATYRGGDFGAMEYLCEKYRGLVSHQSGHFFLKGGEAEDVIQEGMIGLFKAIQEYDEAQGAPFYAFAKLCITRQILKAVEAADRLKNRPLNAYVSLSEPDNQEKGDVLAGLSRGGSLDPEALIIAAQQIEELTSKVLDVLSPMEKQVFELMLEGLDYHSIAILLGKTDKSIDNAMQRIRQKARQQNLSTMSLCT